MEVKRRRGRRRKKLLDDLKDRRGYSHLKEEALDRTMWRNRIRGGFGPVARQNTEWMNIMNKISKYQNYGGENVLNSLNLDIFTYVNEAREFGL